MLNKMLRPKYFIIIIIIIIFHCFHFKEKIQSPPLFEILKWDVKTWFFSYIAFL
jgi:hypothetical protein